MEFPKDKKIELCKNLFWDRNIEPDYVLKLLEGGTERYPGEKINLYVRLLTTYDWYTLLKLIPVDQLKREVLSEGVVNHLFPPALRERYQYARRVLST